MKKIILGILIPVIAIGVLFMLFNASYNSNKDYVEEGIELTQEEGVANFEDCVANGNDIVYFPPILESSPHQCESSDGTIFIENLGIDPDSQLIDWQTCRVPGSLSTFDCPIWMEDVDLDDSYKDDFTIKFNFYNSIDEEQQRAYLSKETNTVVFLIEDINLGEGVGYYGSNSIKIIRPDHEIATLYRNNIDRYSEEFEELKFSPDGQYIYFILGVYDGSRFSIVDISTGSDIVLPDYNIRSYRLDQIVWTSDGRYVAVDNTHSEFAGEGSESIFIGDMVKGDKLIKVFEVERGGMGYLGETIQLALDEKEENIHFSVRSRSNRVDYIYNLSSEELIEVE